MDLSSVISGSSRTIFHFHKSPFQHSCVKDKMIAPNILYETIMFDVSKILGSFTDPSDAMSAPSQTVSSPLGIWHFPPHGPWLISELRFFSSLIYFFDNSHAQEKNELVSKWSNSGPLSWVAYKQFLGKLSFSFQSN